MGKKLLVFTDMDFNGSGYYYLMTPMLNGLAELGYDIKVVGLGYRGEEHNHKFTIVPCASVQDGVAIINNLVQLWYPDLFIVGMDIPIQIAVFNALRQHKLKHVAVTPLENPPLTQTWAASLMQFDHTFFISELGKAAAVRAGLKNVEHLIVGVDSESFYPASSEEKKALRRDLGYQDDDYVILTVADNQERKNLYANFAIVSKLKQMGKKVKFVLVTRKDSPVGYKLQDMALTFGIHRETIMIERGISQEELRKLYVSSDLFLLCSKAEGLGIPILEAMSCGLHCAGTNTGAITELLADGRGIVLPVEYEFIDVWGNSLRSMVDIDKSALLIADTIGNVPTAPNKANLYLETRTFDIPVQQMNDKIVEILNEK